MTMKKNNNSAGMLIILICTLFIFGNATGQQNAILNIGDQAPPLKYSKWIKGEPISSFAGSRLYVLEFWATWCGPCKAAMPHLTQLQQQYKDKVTFIGVGIWEKVPEGKPYESSLPSVEKFVKGNDANMGYAVIADNNKQFMGNKWMKAAGENGIPSTFVVKDNKIIWIGHPNSLDSILPEMLDGKYDMEAFKAKFSKSAVAARKQNAELMAVFTPLQDAVKAKEYAKALELIEQLKVKQPGYKTMMDGMKFKILLDMDEKKAMDFAKEWLKETKSASSVVLGDVYNRDGLSKDTYLWTAGSFGNIETLTNPVLLDALATCFSKGGDYQNALISQEKALELAKRALKDGTMVGSIMDYTVTEYQEKLKKYQGMVN
ncbi:Thiol-disulfide isomerase or thioredoxin [Pedobacter africanus]|uniref:Thiol-disulfide isomerase or thioredoxin n=2 Tax=Pedobacter africanus TaxID=151894 RepID=A0A1W2CVH0_9SPHI|nr:Thiol-disulfide isomerase or thioredoxin [Pedobacter africanus]